MRPPTINEKTMEKWKAFRDNSREKATPITYEVWSPRDCKANQYLQVLSNFKDNLTKIDGQTNFFVCGAVIFERKMEVRRISKKNEARFDFFQSQITFNVENFVQEELRR